MVGLSYILTIMTADPGPGEAMKRNICIDSLTKYNDRLKSPAYRLFAQPFIQAHIKENIKAPRHWPFWWESTGDLWIPLIKG